MHPQSNAMQQLYIYITQEGEVDSALDKLQPYQHLALDTESYPLKIGRASGLDPHTSRVRLLSLCSKDGPAYLFDLDKLTEPARDKLRAFLTDPSKSYKAHNASYDIKVIKGTLGVWVKANCTMVAYQTLSLATGHDAATQRGFSLQAMYRDLLRLPIQKDEQKSDWSRPQLTESQLLYAALDISAPPEKVYRSALLECWGRIKKEAMRLGMEKIWELNQAMVPIIAMMEYQGLAVNTQYLQTLKKGLEGFLAPLGIEVAELLNLTVDELPRMEKGIPRKVKSLPYKTSTLLNNKADLVHVVNKALKLNLPNLMSETLEEYSDDPRVEKLILYTRYTKQLSEATKYLNAPNPVTGRIHPSFKNVGTATNRSTAEGQKDEGLNLGLNIQQAAGIKFLTKAPIKGNPWGFPDDGTERYYNLILRNAIQAPEGYVLIDLDYSKQEIVIGAVMTALICGVGELAILETLWKDHRKEKLLDANGNEVLDKQGKPIPHPLNDIYVATAVALFPELKSIPLEELAKYAKESGPPGTAHGYRHIAKQLTLGIMYGKQAPAFAKELGTQVDVAKKYIRNWHKSFKYFSKYMKEMGNLSCNHKRLKLPWFGYLWVAEANAKGVEDKASIGRKGVNATIQGMGSIVMKLALKYMYEDPEVDFGNTCFPLACIYDGLLVMAPGKATLKGFKQSGDAWAPIFEGDDVAMSYANKFKGHMLRAMSDVLEPILGEPCPSMVDIAGVAPIWLH